MRPIQAELANLPSARQLAAELNQRGIKSATGEGRALAAGVRFGRKPKLSDFQRKEAAARRGNGDKRGRRLAVLSFPGVSW
jgi:hypothetical protein